MPARSTPVRHDVSAPTPEQTRAICDLMEKSGLRVSHCCLLVGVPYFAASGWLETGYFVEHELWDERQVTDDDRACADFYRATKKAHEQWVAHQLEVLEYAQRHEDDPPEG